MEILRGLLGPEVVQLLPAAVGRRVGPWDYATNKERVDQFFREGMERNKAYDNLVTIGMRGDGDVAMGKGDDAENMQTLKNVIEGQRKIIKDIYGRPDAVPQL